MNDLFLTLIAIFAEYIYVSPFPLLSFILAVTNFLRYDYGCDWLILLFNRCATVFRRIVASSVHE